MTPTLQIILFILNLIKSVANPDSIEIESSKISLSCVFVSKSGQTRIIFSMLKLAIYMCLCLNSFEGRKRLVKFNDCHKKPDAKLQYCEN